MVFIMNTGLKKSPHDPGPSFCVAQVHERFELTLSTLIETDDLAIPDLSTFYFRLNLRALDALNAVSALLHHAAAADGYFRVAHQLIDRLFPVLIQKEIKSSHLIRAVV